MAGLQEGWSFVFDEGSSTAYLQEGSTSVATLTGFTYNLSELENGGASTAFEVDGTNIYLKSEALSGLTADSSISITSTDGSYRLGVASGLATAASVSTASLSFSSEVTNGSMSVLGTLSSYYDLGNGFAVTYRAAQTDQTLATIYGLSSKASLSFAETGKDARKTIQLDTADLVSGSAVSLSLASNEFSNLGLHFQLLDGSSESSFLGFGSLSSTWKYGSGDTTASTSAIFQKNTAEGWTISSDSKSVTYTESKATDLFSVSGFSAGLTLKPYSENPSGIYAQDLGLSPLITTTDGKTFSVYDKALGTTTFQLTNLNTAEGSYSLSFAQTGAGSSINGLTPSDPAWKRIGNDFIYGFSTAQGWELAGDSQSISYTAQSGIEAHKLVSISGLNNGNSESAVSGALSVKGEGLSYTITLNDTSILATTEGAIARLIDENAPDNKTYVFALSNTILSAATVDGTAPTISITNGQSTAYILGGVSAYYVLGSDSLSVTTHKAESNYAFATIKGLSTTGVSFVFSDDGGSTIELNKDDLGTTDVSLSRASISGISAYAFSLSTDVLTTAHQINSAVSAKVSVNGSYYKLVDVYGTASAYYTLNSDSNAVTYYKPEEEVIARISGLNTDAMSNVGVSGTRTITLKEGALTDANINLALSSAYGDTGLKLQLMTSSGSAVTSLGLSNSDNYWGISSGTATYQYHVNKGWSSATDTNINFTAQTGPKTRFTISGLDKDIFKDLTAKVGNSSISVASISAGTFEVEINTAYLSKTDPKKITKESDGQNYNFKLKHLANDTDKNDTDTEVGFDKTAYYWKVTKDGNFYTATYTYDISEGWKLDGQGNITYTGSLSYAVMSISGLSGLQTYAEMTNEGQSIASDGIAGITVSSVTKPGGGSTFTFKLSENLLSTSTATPIVLSNGVSAVANDSYVLTVSGISNNKVNFQDSGNYWTVVNDSASNGSASYQHYTQEGWTLTNAGSSYTLSYASATNYAPSVWFTVTGLSGLAAVSEATKTATLPAGISLAGTSVIIDTNYLNKAADITKTLKMETAGTNAGYTFNFKAIDDPNKNDTATKIGFDKSDYYWKVTYNESSAYTATLYYDISEGWEIVGNSTDGYSAVHTDLVTYTLASISGLSNLASVSATTAGSASGVTNIAGISFTEKGGAFAFALSTAVLGSMNVSLSGLYGELGASSTDTFSLALQGSKTDNKFLGGAAFVGFDNYAGAVSGTRYWKVDGTSAVYMFDRAQGWKLDSTATITSSAPTAVGISYFGASSFSLATVEGLVNLGSSATLSAIDGISVESANSQGKTIYTFTLSDDALSGTDVDLTSNTNLSIDSKYAPAVEEELSIAGASVISGKTVYGFGNHDAATNEKGERYWSVSGTSATYKYERAEGWTLENASRITYTGASTFELASISGLTSGLTVENSEINGISVGIAQKGNKTAYTFTLDKSVLGGNSLSVEAVTIAGSSAQDLAGNTVTNSYEFALKDSFTDRNFMSGATVVGFDNYDGAYSQNGKRYWTTASDSATYGYSVAEGWKLENASSITYTAGTGFLSLASISGLSNLTNSTAVASVSGITVGAISTGKTSMAYTFELSNPVLGSSAISLSTASDANTYKLALKDSFTDSNFMSGATVAGFSNYDAATNQNGKRFWTATSDSTATYGYSRAEGWVLDAGASKVAYTGLSTFNDLAHLTGLSGTSTGALQTNLDHLYPTVGSGSVAGTISLTDNVLNVTGFSSVSLSSGDKYKLTLAGVDTIASASHAIYIDDSDLSEGNIIVKETLEGGWLGDSTGKTFTYYDAVDWNLASVSGLNTDATLANIALGTGGNSTVIYITKDALTQTNVALSGISSSAYTLALSGVTTTYGGSVAFGFGNEAKVWGTSGTSLVYYTKTDEGWYLDSNSSITYISELGTYSSLVAIANIPSISGAVDMGASSVEGITISTEGKNANKRTVFTISTAILAGQSGDIQFAGDSTGYALSLAGGSKVGFGKSDEYWSIVGDSATFKKDTYEGWTLENGKIKYTAQSTSALAYIDGISKLKLDGSTTIAANDIDGISVSMATLKGGSSIFTFSIADSLLGELATAGASINLHDNYTGDGIDFKFALADDAKDGKEDGKVGFEASTEYWTAETNGSASYKQDFSDGWALSGTSITYNASVTADLAHITGLSNLQPVTAESRTEDIDGITVNKTTLAGGSASYTFSIGDDLLGASSIQLTTITPANEYVSLNSYALALTSDTDKDGKIGFESLPNSLKPANSDSTNTTAIYYSQTTEGWTLTGMSINFTSAGSTHTPLAQITELAAGLSAELLNGDGEDNPGYILISADNKVLTINSMSAFTNAGSSRASIKTVSGTAGTYSLSIASHLNTQKNLVNPAVSATMTINGTSATIIGETRDYVAISKNQMYVDHVATASTSFATITGLATGASVGTNVFFETDTGDDEEYDPTITLGASALGSTSVSLTLQTGLSGLYDYKLALDDDVITKYAFNGIGGISTDLRADTTNGTSTAVILGSYSTYYLLNPDEKGITYNAAGSIALAEIKGLSNNVAVGNIEIAGNSIIKLAQGALSAYTIELINRNATDAAGNQIKYELAFANDDGNSASGDGTAAGDGKVGFIRGASFWTVDKGVATYGFSTGEGWSIVDDKVVYSAPKVTTLAIITGLSSAVTADNIDTYLTVGGDSTAGYTFTFKSLSAFSDEDLYLTNDFTDGNSKFLFDNSLAVGSDSTKAGFSAATASLAVAKGTAKLLQGIGEGWTIGEDGTTIEHTGATTQVLASVNGLGNKANTTTVTFNNNIFSISTAALTSSDVEVVNGEGISTAYILKLAGDDGTSVSGDYTASGDGKVGFKGNGTDWAVSKGTATYGKLTGEGWTLAGNSKSISYTEAKENASDDVILQITNLNKNLTAEQFKLYGGSSVVAPGVSTKGTIKLSAGALGTGSKTGDTVAAIVGSESYVLTLDNDVVQEANSTNYWTVKNNTATFKQNTSAFYSVSSASTAVIYDKAATDTTLATITNLKSPKTTKVGERPATIEGIAVVKEPTYNTDGTVASQGEILIVSESIISTNTSKPTEITGDYYTIGLGEAVNQTAGQKDLQWTVKNTTATLNNVSKAYYTSDGKSITYTEAGSTTDKLATVSGIKKTVTAAELKKMIATDPTIDSEGKVTTKGKITLTADALNKTNVTISSDYYDLALDSDVKETSTTLGTWSISGTTLTVKGTVTEGYRANTDGSISYLKGQNNTTLLTIKGLPSGLTLNANGTIDGITVNEDTGKVTFSEDFLAKYASKFTKITISGTGYSLDDFTSHTDTNTIYTYKDSAITGKNADGTEVTEGKGIDALRYSGTTATYKRIIPEYFKISGNTLSYVKEADYTYKENKQTKKTIYATVKNLTKGLTLDGNTLKDSNNNDVLTLNSDAKTITLTAGALGTSPITLTSSTYALILDNADKLQQKEDAYLWSISGTSATLYKGKSAGWELSGNTITKKAATTLKNGNKLATITGLKSGLKVTNAVNSDSVVNGLEFDGNTTIKVGDAALAKTTAKITTGKETYSLALADGTSKPSDGYIWSVSGSTLTIKTAATTSAGYTIASDNKSISYTKAGKAGTQIVATLSGLKKGLKIGANGKVDGIVFDSTTKTFTLSKKVLGTTKVTASTGYTIATSSDVATPTSATVWSVSGTKATLKVANTAGFELSADGKTLNYTKASTGSVVATVDGIKKGVKPVTVNKTTKQNKIDGLTVDLEGKTITVGSNVLNNSTISVSGNGGYTLKAGDSVPKSLETTDFKNTNAAWTISGTTATLKKAVSEGYTLSSDGKKLEYTNGKTGTGASIVSVKGLKSGLKVENGEIAGLNFAKITDASGNITGGTITLDSRVLGSTKVLVSDNTYKLALDTSGTKNTPVDGTAGYSCKVSGTTVTLTPLTRKGYVLDSVNNTITASTPSSSSTTFATITGLKSGLKADATSGQISGITFEKIKVNNESVTMVYLDESVLGTTDVKVTLPSNATYYVNLHVDDLLEAKDPTVTASTKTAGSVVLTTTTTKGYKYAEGGSELEYVAPSTVTTTIEGLSGTPTVGVKGTDKSTGDIVVDPTTKTITISNSAVLGSKVTMSGGDYTFELADTLKGTTAWDIKGTTATLIQTTPNTSYTVDGTSITRNSTGAATYKVLATLTGLPEGITASDLQSATITEEDGVSIITLPADLLNKTTSTIKLTGDGYQLALDNEDYDWTPHKTTEAVWSVNGTTATFATGTTAGFTISKDGKTATYSAFKKDGNVKATVTGLKSGVLASDIAAAYSTSGVLTLTANMLGETDVTASGCKVTLGNDVTTKTKAGNTNAHWVIDSGNAIYCDSYKDYYDATSSAVTYHSADSAGNIKTKLATIAGLSNPTVTVIDEATGENELNGVTVDKTNNIFEVAKAAIGTTTSDIKLTTPSGSTYKLALAGDVTEPEKTSSVWSVSGTSATLKDNYSVGYSVSSDGKTISYSSKVTTEDRATLTGLASGLKVTDGAISGIEVDGKTITVSGNVLASVGTASLKSASTTGLYTLKLDRDSVVDDTDEEVRNTTNVWKYDSSTKTSIYKTIVPAHYELISDKNSIKYVAESVKSGGLATITGVKSNIEDDMFDADSKTVTLTTGNLGDTDVSIKGDGYTLALDEDVAAPSVKSHTIGAEKVTGARSKGYTVSENGTRVIYANSTTGETFAAITGMTGKLNSDCVNTDNETVYLDGSMLKDDGVAVSGSFTIDFKNYDNHSINGSTGADKVAVDSGMTVSLGAGDDYVQFAGGGNIFVYNSGDGNDVIADFTASGTEYDQIEIKGTPTISASMSGGDVVIDITKGSGKSAVKGSITLENCNANQIFINGKAMAVSGAADLLYDENNLVTEDAQLDELTGNAFNAYSLEDIDAGTQGLTKLNKQSSLVTYGSNDSSKK